MRINKNKGNLYLVSQIKLAAQMDRDFRMAKSYDASAICSKAIGTYLKELGDLLDLRSTYTEVVAASRSQYVVTLSELRLAIANALVFGKARADHDRGKMPNAYKYTPTSQSVLVTVVKDLKNTWIIEFEQLKS